jgi:nucleoside-diphosphate-sugar epimerase
MPNHSFWQGRKVFLTGHTGFKGSWLSLWLHALGAGTVRNLVCGAIVTPMEGAYGNQERHPGQFAGGA